MIKLSKRMQALADMVTDGNRLADIGTDHGFLPIYLIQQKKIPTAIAMDINRGPLQRAREHIEKEGLSSVIQTRQSDGLQALSEGEADTILIAGMGGGIILHILQANLNKAQGVKEMILQPQSEISMVRGFLMEHHFQFLQEDMILEEGKYYPMMRVRYDSRMVESMNECQLRYGRLLLEQRHPVLQKYLMQEAQVQQKILNNLIDMPSKNDKILERIVQLQQELALIDEVQKG